MPPTLPTPSYTRAPSQPTLSYSILPPLTTSNHSLPCHFLPHIHVYTQLIILLYYDLVEYNTLSLHRPRTRERFILPKSVTHANHCEKGRSRPTGQIDLQGRFECVWGDRPHRTSSNHSDEEGCRPTGKVLVSSGRFENTDLPEAR